MNMSFQEILDTQTGDTPNPDVSATISPQDFEKLPVETQNTILYSALRDVLVRVVHVEARLRYYDKLRFMGFGGLTVATGVGAVLTWITQHFSMAGGK